MMSRKGDYVFYESKKFPGVFYGKKRQTRSEKYAWLYQGKGINILSAIGQNMVDEAIANGNNRIMKEGVLVSFSSKNLVLDDRTVQVLFYIIQKYVKKSRNASFFTNNNILEHFCVELKITDVAEVFNLTVRGTRKMLDRAINSLYDLSVDWEEKIKTSTVNGDSVQHFDGHRFRFLSHIDEHVENDSDGCFRSGFIRVALEPEFSRYLLNSANGIWFPVALYGLSPSRYPASFAIGLKLILHFRMNYYKANRNYINVETLLSATTSIPNYLAIKNRGEISRRIYRPLIRAMDALVSEGIISEWSFINPYTESEVSPGRVLNKMNYKEFKILSINFKISDYPKTDI